MTVAIVGIASGDHVSAGGTFFWTCSGPTALDDHISFVPSISVLSADVVCKGATSGFGMLGFVEASTQFQFIANGGTPPYASGTTFNWTVSRVNHSGSFLEGGPTLTGMIFSPDFASCFNLLSKLSSSGSTLDQILQAVHRVYPST